MKRKLLEREDLKPAAECFAEAAKASRKHSKMVERLIKRHGNGGSPGWVSGIGKDHFPNRDKERLRALCVEINRNNDEGLRLRPKRVRHHTMCELAREVCHRDGTGFYGFRI